MQDRAQMLSQRVEKEVRYQLGDLQMQIIVLRSMMEMQAAQEPQRGESRPNDKPNDPANPHPSPDMPPVPPTRSPSPDPAEQDHPPKQALNGLNGKSRHETREAL